MILLMKHWCLGIMLFLILWSVNPAQAEETSVAEKIAMKFARGVANVTTGWVELPKQIYLVGHNEGWMMGALRGPIDGLGCSWHARSRGPTKYSPSPCLFRRSTSRSSTPTMSGNLSQSLSRINQPSPLLLRRSRNPVNPEGHLLLPLCLSSEQIRAQRLDAIEKEHAAQVVQLVLKGQRLKA